MMAIVLSVYYLKQTIFSLWNKFGGRQEAYYTEFEVVQFFRYSSKSVNVKLNRGKAKSLIILQCYNKKYASEKLKTSETSQKLQVFI